MQAEFDDGYAELQNELSQLADIGSDIEWPDRIEGFDEYPQVGKYQIQKRFSGKTHSQVFLAFDAELKRQVVIKFYADDSVETPGSRIVEEAQALARISSPYVAKCYGIEQVGYLTFLVMEFVNEQNLYETHQDTKFSVVQALKVFKQLNRGLAAIHRQSLLHRDLKPQNIVIDEWGDPKIVDFGLVDVVGERNANETVGTVSYVPPESINNRVNEIGPATDIFGLGTVLYFLLTGRAPFEAATESEAYRLACAGEIEPPRSLNRSLPADVSAFCMNCLRANVLERFQNTDEVDHALRTLERRRWWKKTGVLAGLLLIGLWLSAAGTLFLVQQLATRNSSHELDRVEGMNFLMNTRDGEWRYLWNAPEGWDPSIVYRMGDPALMTGPMGDPNSYRALVLHKDVWTTDGDLVVTEDDVPDGHLAWGADGGMVGRATTGLDRFVIFAFTVNSAGRYVIENSLLFVDDRSDDGVELYIHINDGKNLYSTPKIVPPGKKEPFDQKLGFLEEGDTVYVGVGPHENHSWDKFYKRLDISRVVPGDSK